MQGLEEEGLVQVLEREQEEVLERELKPELEQAQSQAQPQASRQAVPCACLLHQFLCQLNHVGAPVLLVTQAWL